ncbi:MAG: hypothetical protein ACJ8EL_01070 [Rhizomicrobium sp.]
MDIRTAGKDAKRYEWDLHGWGGGVSFRWDGSYHKTHSFCSGGSGCPDGEYPHGQMVMDAAGNLFGTTELGGKYYGGTVFEIAQQ